MSDAVGQWAQVTRDLELFYTSEDEQNHWDPTGKSIEEIQAFLKNGRDNAVIRTVLPLQKNMLNTKPAPSIAGSKVSYKKSVYTTVKRTMMTFDKTRTLKRKFEKMTEQRRKRGNYCKNMCSRR